MSYAILSLFLGPSVPTAAIVVLNLVLAVCGLMLAAIIILWAIATVAAHRPHRPSVAIITDAQEG